MKKKCKKYLQKFIEKLSEKHSGEPEWDDKINELQ